MTHYDPTTPLQNRAEELADTTAILAEFMAIVHDVPEAATLFTRAMKRHEVMHHELVELATILRHMEQLIA